MHSRGNVSNFFLILTVFILSILFFVGCSNTFFDNCRIGVVSLLKDKKEPVYYDFCDVLIPGQLNVDREYSYVFSAFEIPVGVLSLKGRVELDFLVSFFEKNMSNDNWVIMNSFKAKKIMMLFRKENRWCTILISEKKFYTFVEIWVLPTKVDLVSMFID